MAATVLEGKPIANQVYARLTSQLTLFQEKYGRFPGLAVVKVGEDPASEVYVRHKRKKCEVLGIRSFAHDFPATVTEQTLLDLIDSLNGNDHIDGILVQLPLPKEIDANKIIEAIDPDKDVDGFHPYNMGKLFAGFPRLVSCTPLGIMEMLQAAGISLQGKKAVVVGRSNIVGKPIAMLLMQAHATVEICHSRTQNLAAECRSADILIAAVGKKFCILGDWIKPGAVVIDVGINRDESGLCGDVDYKKASEAAAYITPVPGGVGVMTIAMLMANTVKAARLREERKQ
ncbi:bifunctional methylenetetrahydrofolate dehydrogenase/methenyltetrahydrofolate cyclohydrolase FolD [bacterium]|nr:bifunctional methylenetetrahydrofolate dehydrogenase/methenyltetrahydrofolate cyclohydrolase FolD [bacterium]